MTMSLKSQQQDKLQKISKDVENLELIVEW
jgi:hypothetical protein